MNLKVCSSSEVQYVNDPFHFYFRPLPAVTDMFRIHKTSFFQSK